MNDEYRNCDSTSMEMCLLIRKCQHWVERREPDSKDSPQPVVIVGDGIGTCPNCGADIHGRE